MELQSWLSNVYFRAPSCFNKQELRSLKLASGYYEVECEEEEGKSVVSGGDDFTVETALEDLEFGFSIVKSTQKVSYMQTNQPT